MNPISIYECVEQGYPWRLRGPGLGQTNRGLLYQPPTFGVSPRGVPTAGAQTTHGGIRLGGFSLHNRANATQTCVAIGVRIPNYMWVAGTYVNATTTYTDRTAQAQGTTTDGFVMETSLTDNDGFIVGCQVPFNAISINVSTASTGTVARAYRYSTTTSGTSTWTDFANLFIQDGASTNLAITGTTIANEALAVWDCPVEWTKVTSGVTNFPSGFFAVNCRATTGPTVAALATDLSIYRLYFVTESLADNGLYEAFFGASEARMEPTGDALVACFATANNQNRVTAFVRSAD